MIVIGLGTGRCGTVSLTHLLNLQNNTMAVHEPRPLLPWVTDPNLFAKNHDSILSLKSHNKCAVAFYYLNYIELFPSDTIIIALKRNRHDTIESFIKKSNGIRFSSLDEPWKSCFPNIQTKKLYKYFGEYYDLYYKRVLEYQIPTFNINVLNDSHKCKSLLKYIGIKNPKWKRIRKNRT